MHEISNYTIRHRILCGKHLEIPRYKKKKLWLVSWQLNNPLLMKIKVTQLYLIKCFHSLKFYITMLFFHFLDATLLCSLTRVTMGHIMLDLYCAKIKTSESLLNWNMICLNIMLKWLDINITNLINRLSWPLYELI